MISKPTVHQRHSLLIVFISLLLLSLGHNAYAAFPLLFTDDVGHTITLTAPPQRIISLAPSNTEIVFALGLGNRVVGVDSYSNYPAAATQKENVGSGLSPSLERIAALQPDLVLLWDSSAQELQQKLTKLSIKAVVFAPQSLAEVYISIDDIGRLTGSEKAAQALVAEMKKKVTTLTNIAAKASDRPAVLYEVWPDPLYTAGPGSFADELITLAGGRNVAADAKSAWPVISIETVITRNPEVILTPFDKDQSVVSGKQQALWASVKAVKTGRIVKIDQDIISRPGPRLVDGLAFLVRAFHPELF